jgi:hypothetical protein
MFEVRVWGEKIISRKGAKGAKFGIGIIPRGAGGAGLAFLARKHPRKFFSRKERKGRQGKNQISFAGRGWWGLCGLGELGAKNREFRIKIILRKERKGRKVKGRFLRMVRIGGLGGLGASRIFGVQSWVE